MSKSLSESRRPSNSDRGADIGNTPPLKVICNDYGGEDWLEGGMQLQWTEKAFESAMSGLEDAQKAARRGREGFFSVGDFKGTVAPAGFGTGGGSGGYFAYRITVNKVDFSFRTEISCESSSENFRYCSTGTSTMILGGAVGVKAHVTNVLAALGASAVSDKLSRIDQCLDMAKVDVEDFTLAYKQHRFITRAKNVDLYIRQKGETGLTLGKGSVSCRIYDKIEELSGNIGKVELMRNLRWGEAIPSCATRIEFQMRRAFLKELGVSSMDDYIRKRGDVARYLTKEWLRIADKGVDRNNTGLEKIWPTWERVERGFIDCFGEGKRLKRARVAEPNVNELQRQAVGCLVSSFVLKERGELPERKRFLKFCLSEFSSFFNDLQKRTGENIADMVEKKILKRGTISAHDLVDAVENNIKGILYKIDYDPEEDSHEG